MDVVGMDNYWDFRPDGGDTSLVVLKSRILTKYAILYLEGVELNYLCTWSGFAPYKGHPAASDFYQFKEDSLILFADEAPDFYVLTK